MERSTEAADPAAQGRPPLVPLVVAGDGAPLVALGPRGDALPAPAHLTATAIWAALVEGMVPGERYLVPELYELVAARCTLLPRDLEPEGPTTTGPRWQRNVRNVLHRRKGSGHLRWDGHGGFVLRWPQPGSPRPA